MSQETNETKQEAAAAAEPAPAAEAPKADAPKAAKEKAAVVIVPRGKGGRPKQCTQCSKNLKKKTWYYRDNKYFCNKTCWKTSKVPKAAAAA